MGFVGNSFLSWKDLGNKSTIYRKLWPHFEVFCFLEPHAVNRIFYIDNFPEHIKNALIDLAELS